MTEIRNNWHSELPSIPEDELEFVYGAAGVQLSECACCFWLFRFLHRIDSPSAVLTGDYCFGRFSHHLAKLDSVALTNAFAAYLKQDTLEEKPLEDYLEFLKSAAGMI